MPSRTTFTGVTRRLRPTRAAGIGLLVIGASAVLVGGAPAYSTASMGPPVSGVAPPARYAESHTSDCSDTQAQETAPNTGYKFTTVHGYAWTGVCDRLAGRILRVSLHRLPGTNPVMTHDRTNSSGAFAFNIHHSRALAEYADRHAGKLNLDLSIHGIGDNRRILWSNTLTVPYFQRQVYTGQRLFRLVHHFLLPLRGKAGVSPDLNPPEQIGRWQHTGAVAFILESTPNSSMVGVYSTNRQFSMTGGAGTTIGNFTLDGSITVAGETSTADTRTEASLDKPMAQSFDNSVRVRQALDCVTTFAAPGQGYRDCTYKTVATWSPGLADPIPAPYLNCSRAMAGGHWFRNTNGAPYNQRKASQKTITVEAVINVGVVRVSSSYRTGSGTSITSLFKVNGYNGKYAYCRGGNNSSFWFASRAIHETHYQGSAKAARRYVAGREGPT